MLTERQKELIRQVEISKEGLEIAFKDLVWSTQELVLHIKTIQKELEQPLWKRMIKRFWNEIKISLNEIFPLSKDRDKV